MSLSEVERNEVVKYRLEKANSTFAEIDILIKNKFFRNAANRLYYACYYAATALLINGGYETHSHKGVISMMSLHFFKENKIEKSYSKIYDNLFRMRLTGDYDDFVFINEEDIKPFIEPSKEFIKTIEKLINQNTL